MVLDAEAVPTVEVVVPLVLVELEVPWIVRCPGIDGEPLRPTGFVLPPVPVLPPLVLPVDVEPLVVPDVSGVALAAAMPNFIAASPASAAPTSGAAPLKWSLKFGMLLPWS